MVTRVWDLTYGGVSEGRFTDPSSRDGTLGGDSFVDWKCSIDVTTRPRGIGFRSCWVERGPFSGLIHQGH